MEVVFESHLVRVALSAYYEPDEPEIHVAPRRSRGTFHERLRTSSVTPRSMLHMMALHVVRHRQGHGELQGPFGNAHTHSSGAAVALRLPRKVRLEISFA